MTYAYTDASQTTVLEAVVELLKTTLNLNDRRCYLTMPDLDAGQMPPGGDYWLEVSPGDSHAPEDFQIGGGAHQVVEQATFDVTIFNRVKLDASNKAKSLLEANKRGLWQIQTKVIATLADVMPTDAAGNRVTMNPLFYMGSTRPHYDQKNSVSYCAVMFGTDYDLGDILAASLTDE